MRIPSGVRLVIDPLVERVPVKVLAGPNRGRWWSLASAGSGHWNGRKEGARLQFLEGLIQPGDVFWDVGAHHGYVALLASRRVLPGGEVHAFEPSSRNRRLAQRHLRWNRTPNVWLHPYALGATDGRSTFGGTGTSKTLALGGGGEVVEVRAGRNLVASGKCRAPTVLKIDVEGAEAEVLRGVLDVVPPAAAMLIAVHSPEVHRACVELVRDAGFEPIPSRSLEQALAGPWKGDPDVLCVGPQRATRERDIALLRSTEV